MERGDVQDNAIVEVGFQMQVRRSTQFVLEVPQFGEEVFLPFNFLGESLGFLAGFATAAFWLRRVSRRLVSKRIFGST